jgi:hypothetical protein
MARQISSPWTSRFTRRHEERMSEGLSLDILPDSEIAR